MFTGLTFDDACTRFPEEHKVLLRRDPHATPPEGESYLQCQARAAEFLDQAMTRHAGQCVVMVSHHLTVHLLMLHILGLQLTAESPRVYVQLQNCALHRLEHYDDGVWQVLALNDAARDRKIDPKAFYAGVQSRAQLEIPSLPADGQPAVVQMVGFPRSGTTLLENALAWLIEDTDGVCATPAAQGNAITSVSSGGISPSGN